ncbi:MAG: NUDIX domain-containing protein [Candidatus Dormibacteria bacterium]
MRDNTGVNENEIFHLREHQRSRTERFQGRLLTVVEDEAELADGTQTRREIVLHRGAVAIIPILDDGRIVLVRQWRYPHGRPYWEVPAGTIDKGEAPDNTAHRELSEETGYDAASWRYLGEGPVSPGYSTEMIYFFLAQSLTPGEQHTDHDERLDVRAFTLEECEDLISSHDVDIKTIAALHLLRTRGTHG